MASRRRRTQSFGGFLSNDTTGDSMPFQLLMPPSEFNATDSSVCYSTASAGMGTCTSRHTSAPSPVRTCSSVDDTLNENPDNATSVGGVTSASYIRLFPYLNRSSSIENQQQQQSGGNLRRSGGQSCPSVDVRCDIVEYL